MGVPYDVLNADTQDLTAAMLASSSAGAACKAEDAGCLGNYNGIILTDADLDPNFTPAEWDILHNYQKNFGVRKRCCQDGQPHIRIRSLLTGSTWIMVWSIRPAETTTMLNGQCLPRTARKFLSM